ncbi:MAG: sensor histidine kinase [Magnetococcales bacterium]|nr:sensor histidine kinase [Magnetococcales bacterium]
MTFRSVAHPHLSALLLSLSLLLLPLYARAHGTLILTPEIGSADLDGYLDMLEDPQGHLTIDTVSSPGYRDRFQALEAGSNAGFREDALWFRVQVRALSPSTQPWILELFPAIINDLRVYIPEPTRSGTVTYRETRFGDHVSSASYPIRTRLFTLPLTFADDQPVTLYFRLTSNSALFLKGAFYTSTTHTEKESLQLFIHGAYTGVLVILIISYLWMGLLLRDGVRLAYSGYLITILLVHSGTHGILLLFISTSLPWLLDLLVGIGVFGGMAMASLLLDRVCDLRRIAPRLHRLYTGYALLVLFCIPLSITHFHRFYALFLIPTLVAVLYGLFLVRRRLSRGEGYRGDHYLLWAFAPSVFAVAVDVLAKAGALLPIGDFTLHIYQASSLAHIILLNMAMAERIKAVDQGRIRAQEHAREVEMRAQEQRNFLAILSHEFKAPLARISSMAQMVRLLQPAAPNDVTERLSGIREQSDLLTHMVERVLTSESLTQGSLILERRTTNLESLVDAIRSDMVEENDRRRLQLEIVPAAPEGSPLLIDSYMVTLAVGNAVTNALKYSPAPQPVFVRFHQQSDQLSIDVRDTGPGMKPEEVDRFREMYRRGSSIQGTTGTGLGGHIINSVVTAHSGNLSINSTPGEGTTITMTFAFGD